MVLSLRVGALACLAFAAACNQSLFDNHGGGGGVGGGDDTPGPDAPQGSAACPTTCLGDAAANYDGTPRGTNGRWRYLEDQNLVSWLAMAGGPLGMTGQDAGNRITACSAHNAAACSALPGALLVSSSAASPVDPAIEFTAPASEVIQLGLRAYLAAGADQTIRIYRNSRADLVLAARLTATIMVDQTLVVDAVMGDRFLVAISGDEVASDVALQLFVSATGAAFPQACQLAMPFATLDPKKLGDPCGGSTFTYFAYQPTTGATTAAAVPFAPGPFAELEPAIDIPPSHHLSRDLAHRVDWSHDTTLQFWLRLRTLGGHEAFVVTDRDPDQCSGVDLSLFPLGSAPQLQLQACVNPATMAFDLKATPYPQDAGWHFVRLVRAADRYDLCIDGGFAATLPALPDAMATSNAIELGKEGVVMPADDYLDGQLDDLRVFSTALPCH